MCKIEKFFEYATTDAAVWVRVAFSFDRVVAVLVPLYVGRCCGRQTSARVYVVVAAVAAIAKNMHLFWTRGAQFKTIVVNGTIVQSVLVDVCGYPTPEYKVSSGIN